MDTITPLKVVFVGEPRSGKTWACSQLFKKGYCNHEPYSSTIGAYTYNYTNLNCTSMCIWDCGSNNMDDSYFIDADICVIFGTKQYDYFKLVKKVSPDVIMYSCYDMKSLNTFIQSITNLGPVGNISDSEITVINVMA